METRVNTQLAKDQSVSLNWNTFWLSHWLLPLPTSFAEKKKGQKEEKKRPYSAAAERSGQPRGKAYSGCVCAPLSLAHLGLGDVSHGGEVEVEASTVLSQQLGLARGNRGPVPQTRCRGGRDSKATVLAICHLKSCVHVYIYICAAGCSSSAR